MIKFTALTFVSIFALAAQVYSGWIPNNYPVQLSNDSIQSCLKNVNNCCFTKDVHVSVDKEKKTLNFTGTASGVSCSGDKLSITLTEQTNEIQSIHDFKSLNLDFNANKGASPITLIKDKLEFNSTKIVVTVFTLPSIIDLASYKVDYENNIIFYTFGRLLQMSLISIILAVVY